MLENMAKLLNGYEFVGVEGSDMLWKKEYTQEVIVEIVNTASEGILIIITEKNIEERVPKLLKVLKETNIIHFEKKEK